MKTNITVAPQGASDDVITQHSGLLEPYTITKYFDEPSIAQSGYADNLNIIYPPDCTVDDLSSLINRQLNGDYKNYINADLLEYASMYNVYISSYSYDSCGVYVLIKKLPAKERIIFFSYFILRSE